MSIFKKAYLAVEKSLDNYLEKSSTNSSNNIALSNNSLEKAVNKTIDIAMDTKGVTELDSVNGTASYGYKERMGLIGPQIMKTMSRKDSIIAAVQQTRIHQFARFTKYQTDKYSPGWILTARDPIDYSEEDKMKLADPLLIEDEEAYKQAKFEMDQKLSAERVKAKKEIRKTREWIECCGWDVTQFDMSKRMDFETFCAVQVRNRLTYNHVAVETAPTKDRSRVHHIYPVDAGTVRLVSRDSAERYTQQIINDLIKQGFKKPDYQVTEPFRYVQIVRGQIRAAWTEKEMVFLAANPTVDPEDQGYGFGEMEMLVQIITAHLYAEAHNRNFFTQGIGSKGILHIKGENLSRAQLEGFKRQWLNQAVNSKNAFRPPIIGMADDVKWVQLAQSNRDMEFDSWMHYLIKIVCAIFQIDPAEINFDISKVTTSTLNEANNEQRLKSSRDKGLNSLLKFMEDLMNKHILPRWDVDIAKKYKFEFVGLEAESRKQEIERFEKEVMVWKTVNEIRKEMGYPPMENGDIIMNGAYTQYVQMQQQHQLDAQTQAQGGGDSASQNPIDLGNVDVADEDEFMKLLTEQPEDKSADKKADNKDVKKSNPTIVEWYIGDNES